MPHGLVALPQQFRERLSGRAPSKHTEEDAA